MNKAAMNFLGLSRYLKPIPEQNEDAKGTAPITAAGRRALLPVDAGEIFTTSRRFHARLSGFLAPVLGASMLGPCSTNPVWAPSAGPSVEQVSRAAQSGPNRGVRLVDISREVLARVTRNVTSNASAVGDKVPAVHHPDLNDPDSFFLAQDFQMRHKDVMFAANSPAAELQKFLNLIGSVILPLTAVRSLPPSGSHSR